MWLLPRRVSSPQHGATASPVCEVALFGLKLGISGDCAASDARTGCCPMLFDCFLVVGNNQVESFPKNATIPPHIAHYCLPQEPLPDPFEPPPPFFLPFLCISPVNGSRIYGSSLVVFEEQRSQPRSQYVPKALVFLSAYPFFRGFEALLRWLYMRSVGNSWKMESDAPGHSATTPAPSVPQPIEHFLVHFMFDIPVPTISAPQACANSLSLSHICPAFQIWCACRFAITSASPCWPSPALPPALHLSSSCRPNCSSSSSTATR